MRRISLLLFLCSSLVFSLQAQSWLLYDASVLPSETGGAELDLTSLSQDSPGPNFVEAIEEDPAIENNRVLNYSQPDELNIAGDGNATKMYRWYLEDSEGAPWSGDALTIVARLKGFDDWEAMGLDRVFDLQYRISNTNTRDELRLHYDGNRLELERADVSTDLSIDLTEWHIFRIAFEGTTSTVYIDENPVPVLVADGDGTGDLYLKFGDGSGDKVGGLVDWIGVDTTGAYSPEEGPLDDRFTGAGFNASDYKIAFLSKEVDDQNNLNELDLINDLRKRGFQVDVTYNNPGSIVFPIDFDFSFEALNDYDLVIVGRGVSSGDYTEAAEWAAVETPVLYMSAYIMRNSRLQMINSGSVVRETGDGNTVDPDRVTNVSIVDGPLFTGLDEDMDGEIGYHTWFYEYLAYGADTFEMNHNATLHAALATNGGAGDGNVYVTSWEAGAVPYDGSEAGALASRRLYFQMGSDDQNSPKLKNYFAFTDESTLLFHNSIKWLLGLEPDGKVIPAGGPVAIWKFDAAEGDAVADGLGIANGDIRNGNGVTRESCGIGNSLNFAGATKETAVVWVDDVPTVNFDSTQSFSVSILAKIDPFANTAEMNLILKGDNRSDGMHLPNGNGHYYTVATKDGELRFAVDDDIVKTQLGVSIDETMFPPDKWNHIVAVRDLQEDSVKLYLNGVLVGSQLDETENDISTDGLPVVIGNYHSGPRKINGNIDEVAIFDFAMTATDVEALFASVALDEECEVLYTVSEASNDASLASLEISVGELDPAFAPEVTAYKAELPEGTTSVDISAMANHPAATVSGTGTFSTIPGTATITVTAEDATTRDYTINFSIEGAGNQKIIVEPGFGTIEEAIAAVNDGDTLVLKNGEFYWPIETYQISKKLVIIAESVPSLPGLANQPIIENLFTVNPVFKMNFGGDLHLIGIDVDAQGVANIFDVRGDVGVTSTFSMYINRCRLHNTTEDILNEARDGGGDETRMERCVVRNSFIYDSGAGHGMYVKNFHGVSEFVFENITYWNVGQQFNWIRHYPDGITQPFVYNHMTGYNLSTDLGQDKELFGNSDGANESTLDIDMKNSIFHTQVSGNEGSLKFNNTSERHSIDINNNVLFNVAPIFDLGGTINKSNNMVGTDPMFVDPDNGDFTVMNSALYGAADDGKIIGATYWHPDFVDDFSDLNTSVQDFLKEKYALKNYPNPFVDNTTLSFKLEESAEVELVVFDLRGKMVEQVFHGPLPQGVHTMQFDAHNLNPGLYFYQLRSQGEVISSKMIKL